MKLAEALKVAKPILFNTEMVQAIQGGRKTATRRIVKPQPPKDSKGTYERMDNGNFQLKVAPYDTIYDYEIKPKYQVGDILYVRETWKRFCGMLYGWENGTYIPLDDFEGYQYKAGEQCICTKGSNPLCGGFEDQKSDIHFDDNWHPSIHMPKEAARIFLRVTEVRVERLQDSFFKSGSTILSLLREGLDMHKQCREDIDVFYGSPHCRAGKDECSILSKVRSDYADLWNSTVKESDIYKYGWAANPWVWVIEFEKLEVTK